MMLPLIMSDKKLLWQQVCLVWVLHFFCVCIFATLSVILSTLLILSPETSIGISLVVSGAVAFIGLLFLNRTFWAKVLSQPQIIKNLSNAHLLYRCSEKTSAWHIFWQEFTRRFEPQLKCYIDREVRKKTEDSEQRLKLVRSLLSDVYSMLLSENGRELKLLSTLAMSQHFNIFLCARVMEVMDSKEGLQKRYRNQDYSDLRKDLEKLESQYQNKQLLIYKIFRLNGLSPIKIHTYYGFGSSADEISSLLEEIDARLK